MLSDILSHITTLLQLGGPVVTVIAGLSVIALALILVKGFEFTSCRIGTSKRAPEATTLWLSGRPGEAKDRLSSARSAAEKSVLTALQLLENRAPRNEIEDHVSVAATRDLHQFSKGVRALEAIAQIAPLIGLFGTVLGMIEAFQALQSAGSNVDPSALAGGIWVALMTTAAGLGVAMPVSLVVSWLEGRLEAERVAIETLTSTLLLKQALQISAPGGGGGTADLPKALLVLEEDRLQLNGQTVLEEDLLSEVRSLRDKDTDSLLILLAPPQDPDVTLSEANTPALPPPDALYAHADGSLRYRERAISAQDYLAQLNEEDGERPAIRLAADKALKATDLLQHVSALYSAAAITLSTPPDLEIEGGGPVSHAVLGQSPFDTVVAGTTAAVAHAQPVPPNPVQQPSDPEQVQRALPPDADQQQPVQPTSSKPVAPESPPVTTPLPSSLQVAPLITTNAAGVAFPEAARPATQPASSAPATTAKQPDNLKKVQSAPQPSKAVRVENRTTKAVATSDQKAAPTTVQTVAAAASPQQSARTETEAVPLPPAKPTPPRQTPVTRTQTASKKPEKETQRSPANTRSGAGGNSAQTSQKGGSQKQGARTPAGNSDVTNYPAKVHRKLLRAVRAPRGGRKARKDAVVRLL
eukprot:g2180.t1